MRTTKVVGSSNIKEIAYDPATKRAEVQFNGARYFAEGVDADDFASFEATAGSKDTSTGKHFNANLKSKYQWKKV